MNNIPRGIGLLAPEPIRWLLSKEADVKRRVEAFIRGEQGPAFDVAGPPDASEILKLNRSGPNGAVPLPCVRLHLKMTEHHLTHQKAVAVTCSDDDILQIANWRRRDLVRRALEKKGQPIYGNPQA